MMRAFGSRPCAPRAKFGLGKFGQAAAGALLLAVSANYFKGVYLDCGG